MLLLRPYLSFKQEKRQCSMVSSLKLECIQLIYFVKHKRQDMKLFQVPKLQNCLSLRKPVLVIAEKFL